MAPPPIRVGTRQVLPNNTTRGRASSDVGSFPVYWARGDCAPPTAAIAAPELCVTGAGGSPPAQSGDDHATVG
jgi:hypothetical protein